MKKTKFRRAVAWVMVLVLMLAAMPYALAAEKASAPTSVEVNEGERQTVIRGGAFQLTATVTPADAPQAVAWTSSNKAVATVTADGLVVARKKGIAKITAVTIADEKTDAIWIEVLPYFSEVQVRFYGIGNATYERSSVLRACIKDVDEMAAMYDRARFLNEGVETNVFYDQKAAGIINVLDSMVKNPSIDEYDITIFFYSGHGDGGPEAKPQNQGALVGIDEVRVPVDTVQSYLDKVPGVVIVMMDSCYSGSFIKGKGTGEITEADLYAAGNAWVRALSASKAMNFDGKALTNSPQMYKYRLLTASSNDQLSSITGGTNDMGLFTAALIHNVNSMKADTNRDKIVTLQEAYVKTHATVEWFRGRINAELPYERQLKQVTQIWPKGNSMPIYARSN